MIIHYLDAYAGSGKTYSAIQQSVNHAKLGAKIALVQPSTKLLSQTEKDILTADPNVNVLRIDSIIYPGRVITELTSAIKKAPEGTIVLFSHRAYQLLQYWHNKSEWDLIWDEVLDPLQDLSLKITESSVDMFPIFDLFDFTTNDFADCYTVTIKLSAFTQVVQIANNKFDDDVYRATQAFCTAALSQDVILYVNKQSLERIRNQDFDSKTKLYAYGILQYSLFEGFNSVTILSALFTTTPLYYLFKNQGVKFVENKKLKKSLRYDKHYEDVNLYYMYDIPKWSKNFYSKTLPSGESILHASADAVGKFYDGDVFAYQENKSEPAFSGFKNAEPIPHSAHGLNCFQYIHNFTGVGAYLGDAQYFKFCERYGVDEVVLYARMIHQYYQAMMRTSKRNPKNTVINNDVLPTKLMCQQMKVHFPNARIKQLPDTPIIPDYLLPKTIGKRGKGANNFWSDEATRRKITDAHRNANKKVSYASSFRSSFSFRDSNASRPSVC